MNPQLWSYCLARGLHRHIFRQDTVLYKTDHTVLRILVKFSWHIPDFPIYSDGTKPGTLHPDQIHIDQAELSGLNITLLNTPRR